MLSNSALRDRTTAMILLKIHSWSHCCFWCLLKSCYSSWNSPWVVYLYNLITKEHNDGSQLQGCSNAHACFPVFAGTLSEMSDEPSENLWRLQFHSSVNQLQIWYVGNSYYVVEDLHPTNKISAFFCGILSAIRRSVIRLPCDAIKLLCVI